MIYFAHEALRLGTRPLAWWLDTGQKIARSEDNPLRETMMMRTLATLCEIPARQLKDYRKKPYEVRDALGDLELLIEPEVIASRPFADLLRFNADDGRADKPKVLIVAALSGHHATLLQATVSAFVEDFDTYITDWKDARLVPLEDGDFGFDDYVEYVMEFLEKIGPDTHVVATCQAAPPSMVATAVLAWRNSQAIPASLTLMGGPIDTRVDPAMINKMAEKVPLKLMALNNIHKVPPGYPGSGRRVYPGFYQLTGFIALNPKPHFQQYYQFAKNSVKGEDAALEKFRSFYDEYFAVLDMAETFYLESIEKVFINHDIPKGTITFRGEPVDFASIENLRLLTVEGGNDNFCPPGQTEAAHDVFSGILPENRKHHLQPDVGHYGVFSGSKFYEAIYPAIRAFIENGKVSRRSVVAGSA